MDLSLTSKNAHKQAVFFLERKVERWLTPKTLPFFTSETGAQPSILRRICAWSAVCCLFPQVSVFFFQGGVLCCFKKNDVVVV